MNRLFDQEARDRERKWPDQTLLVEASAGTGARFLSLRRKGEPA